MAIFVVRRRLRGTTLVAPCLWAMGAYGLLAVVEVAAFYSGPAVWVSHLRFLAAGATFCPLMALLGAKRPQDRGWQFVVLSLLALVAFYALTELAYRPHRPLALHWVVRWLLIAPLLAIGLLNHLLTRYWLPAMLVAVGQGLLLAPQFPEFEGWLPTSLTDGPGAADATALAGIVALSTGALVAIALARGQPPEGRTTSAVGLERAWLDFRDQFGALWGLRVAARFNQSAEQLRWEMRLGWHGLESAVPPPHDPNIALVPTEPAARPVFESLLRRFVDDAWLASRWGSADG
jgi:hypothetical protein